MLIASPLYPRPLRSPRLSIVSVPGANGPSLLALAAADEDDDDDDDIDVDVETDVCTWMPSLLEPPVFGRTALDASTIAGDGGFTWAKVPIGHASASISTRMNVNIRIVCVAIWLWCANCVIRYPAVMSAFKGTRVMEEGEATRELFDRYCF